MAKGTQGINTHPTVNPEGKWIKVQEVGLAQLLAIPVAIVLLALLGIFTLASICLTVFALATSGYCCLRYGDEKRQELRKDCLGVGGWGKSGELPKIPK